MSEDNDFWNEIFVASGQEVSMNNKNLSDELIPLNPNLVKPKRKRGRAINAKKIKIQTPQTPQALVYEGTVDPFKNAHHFIKFYRSIVERLTENRAKFDDWASDGNMAAQILDLLIENNRSDIIFIRAWIRYYFDNNLKGEKALKIKYTSLRAFKDTFDKFNSTYFTHQ